MRNYIKMLRGPCSTAKNKNTRTFLQRLKPVTVSSMDNQSKFGCLFDIDGVLLRGKTPIPVAAEALKMIYKVLIRNPQTGLPITYII